MEVRQRSDDGPRRGYSRRRSRSQRPQGPKGLRFQIGTKSSRFENAVRSPRGEPRVQVHGVGPVRTSFARRRSGGTVRERGSTKGMPTLSWRGENSALGRFAVSPSEHQMKKVADPIRARFRVGILKHNVGSGMVGLAS